LCGRFAETPRRLQSGFQAEIFGLLVEGGSPELRIYLRAREESSEEAEWLWIERRF
jgi:hypothetical protein